VYRLVVAVNVRFCRQSSTVDRQSPCNTECLLTDDERPWDTAHIHRVSATPSWAGCVWGV